MNNSIDAGRLPDQQELRGASDATGPTSMVPKLRWTTALAVAVMLFGCVSKDTSQGARIVVYGDSMMDWNRQSGTSTPDMLAKFLGEPVQNQAITAARISHPINPLLDIRKQALPGDWKIAIVNGGANDMIFECACGPCAGNLNRLISKDGQTGQLPDFLRALRAQGSHVMYTGYHRPRNMNTPVRGCGDEIDVLETRIRKLTRSEERMSFVSLAEAFPPGDTSYYDIDRFHPSRKGSGVLAEVLLPYVQSVLEETELASGDDGG